MTSQEWLTNVKVGDQVLLYGSMNQIIRKTVVTRLTQTQIIVAGKNGEFKYRRSDGSDLFDPRGFIQRPLGPYDEKAWTEAKRAAKKIKMSKALAATKWGSLPFDEVEALYNKYCKKE